MDAFLKSGDTLDQLPTLLGDMQRWIAQERPPEISYEDDAPEAAACG